jgi:hypothetical protein
MGIIPSMQYGSLKPMKNIILSINYAKRKGAWGNVIQKASTENYCVNNFASMW